MDPKAVSSKAITRITTHGEPETLELGQKLARNLQPGDVVVLRGGLGAGKTALIRGICRGLEVHDRVTSPTFIFMNQYSGKLAGNSIVVYHFDFYRITSSSEATGFDLDDYFEGDNICLIEWPERVEAFLPEKRHEVVFREIVLENNLRVIETSLPVFESPSK